MPYPHPFSRLWSMLFTCKVTTLVNRRFEHFLCLDKFTKTLLHALHRSLSTGIGALRVVTVFVTDLAFRDTSSFLAVCLSLFHMFHCSSLLTSTSQPPCAMVWTVSAGSRSTDKSIPWCPVTPLLTNIFAFMSNHNRCCIANSIDGDQVVAWLANNTNYTVRSMYVLTSSFVSVPYVCWQIDDSQTCCQGLVSVEPFRYLLFIPALTTRITVIDIRHAGTNKTLCCKI